MAVKKKFMSKVSNLKESTLHPHAHAATNKHLISNKEIFDTENMHLCVTCD